MTGTYERTTHSARETFGLGRVLGRTTRAGDVFALTGPLGAGKTQFVKGLAAGLSVPVREPVVSPTFVLIREYAGRLKLYHIDAYRLAGPGELLALGSEELMAEPGSIVAVEWADRVSDAIPPQACWIELDHAGRNDRRIRIRWPDAERLAAFSAALPAQVRG